MQEAITGLIVAWVGETRTTTPSFMTGAGFYSHDSMILNYEATYTGQYYLVVGGTGVGDYDLLLTGISTVPEPASMAIVGLGSLALLRRRRKESS